MLNCFKDHKICTNISRYILDFVQQEKTKFTMEQPYLLPSLYCYYHACWCPGDLRSHGSSRHGIDQISQSIPSLAMDFFIHLNAWTDDWINSPDAGDLGCHGAHCDTIVMVHILASDEGTLVAKVTSVKIWLLKFWALGTWYKDIHQLAFYLMLFLIYCNCLKNSIYYLCGL